MKIQKDTVCYMSERGHKNFIYPSNRRAIIKEGCYSEIVNFIHGGSRPLKSIRIKKSCLRPYDPGSILNTSPPDNDSYTIVWINKNV
tara:strand:+ start:992 stop:1252 length:261 start_codon:yes stop_codon:yes gene_type:complete